MKYKVSIVGAIDKGGLTGHTNPKIFLYQKSLIELGFDVSLFSTQNKKIIFKILLNIISAFKYGDTILFMLGGAGCRKLTSLILFLNKFFKKRIILNPYGTGPLNPLLKNKDNNFAYNFIYKKEFNNMTDKKLGKKLKLYDAIMLETNTLIECYSKFYNLNNLSLMPNYRFRSFSSGPSHVSTGKLRFIFASRVTKQKGILDLMKVVNEINRYYSGVVSLDIFGNNHLSDSEMSLFNENISFSNGLIKYHGIVPNEEIQNLISDYDLACLPTRHNGEGAPGFIVESLISGVPVLVSSFSQVYDLIDDNVDGFIYELGNNRSLYDKIDYIIQHKSDLVFMRENAAKKGYTLTFDYNKNKLYKLIIGE